MNDEHWWRRDERRRGGENGGKGKRSAGRIEEERPPVIVRVLLALRLEAFGIENHKANVWSTMRLGYEKPTRLARERLV